MNAEQKVLAMMEEAEEAGSFVERHIGPRERDLPEMLSTVGVASLAELIDKTVPPAIRLKKALNLPAAVSERAVIAELRKIAELNKQFKSYIGMGYHDCITPPVIQRNILENPGWYTQYTPYQAEISQGRLEALVNYQTMICDLTGMEVANASLLDEGTAAAEAMMMCHRLKGSDTRNEFLVSSECHPHVIEVVEGRAEPIGVKIKVCELTPAMLNENTLGILVPYPCSTGEIYDWRACAEAAKKSDAFVVVDADLLSLCLLSPPGEWGADIVIGNSQRFGVPLGFGGPHAAYMSIKDEYRRELPGRLVGVSKDASGKPAYRLALQTREQHIRRDKATSNICTAQVLLAIMASMYAVYHGPKGVRKIAEKVQFTTARLATALQKAGYTLRSSKVFDTICIESGPMSAADLNKRALQVEVNLRLLDDGAICISLNETVTEEDLLTLGKIFGLENIPAVTSTDALPASLKRTSSYLSHPVYNTYHSETEFLRYITRLQTKDLSLATAMIPLGSCTMKLNATSEMIPVTWGEFGNIHPFVPKDQALGYEKLISQLESMLAEITGLAGVSLQPNAGSQGEYAGLLTIRAYHLAKGDTERKICLIPTSAHGTNPATASMAGMKVVTVACDEAGNVDLESLQSRISEYGKQVAGIMVTYPSTHGVFEETISQIVALVHGCGGLVYMDGANMNAQVGLCRPGDFGVDVCHLNLHKTFCIPHGGGGPGVGPIAVASHLVPFLPRNIADKDTQGKNIKQVSSAPWGSAGILVIPWVYIRLMGPDGLKRATELAILNANYVASRLESSFPVLYRGKNGTVAHECILDLRNFKRSVGVDVTDVAKRLMDYGFHAPTVSFPVVETMMVEPTESESKEELDRFCDAMIAIREEIAEVQEGRADKSDNVLKNAPHTALEVCSDAWGHPYSREKAAYPCSSLKEYKFWPAVARIDNAWGDRNLFCACVPVEGFDDSSK